jgi:hypothetical protein
MKLKEILLAGSLLLSSQLFSQEGLKFDISSDRRGISRLIANNSSLSLDSNKIDFSFLYGLYSMEFEKINDSTYRETVKNNFLWKSNEEVFDYSLKDSCYILDNYSARGGKPREEKEILEGTSFDKKYKTFPELFDYFKEGLLGDSLHCIVLGLPYSIKIEKNVDDEKIIYSCSLNGVIKEEAGDFIVFPYPVEIHAENKNEKLIPFAFFTKYLNVKNGKNTSLEGELRKND